MLEVSNLTKAYRTFVAVNNLSFTVGSGELVGLIGPNGAGKSTTLKAIAGQIHYDAGKIEVNGINVQQSAFEAKRFVGYVPQQIALYPFLSGREMLEFVSDIKGLTEEQRASSIEQLIVDLRLEDFSERLIREYSEGTAKKLAFAVAALGSPQVFLLDEVFTGLDPHTSHYLREKFLQFRSQGCAIIFASHILETVEKLCDRVILMNKGSIIRDISKAEMRADDRDLESIFLEMTSQ